MKKVISIINHKGGVGKTTSAVNIGAGLNVLGKKVLLIDFDPQANLTINLGLDTTGSNNIYGALRGEYLLPIVNYKENIDVVCSTLDLSVAEMELNQEPARESILKRLIAPVLDKYDYIAIDCPPSLGLLTLNALTASQLTIIPIELSNFAIVGMTKLFEVISKVRERINPELENYRILMTRTDKRQAIHKELSEYLLKKFNENIFQTEIRSNVKILESQMEKKDIFSFDKNSKGAIDYMNLCNEIIHI
ncbi:Sporulation initiation inhibitor protein Soj [termite gut metagenome]|uniref:Sporulation initiation inhibitor protein Soj n=1 Tax=termite gut metagenome TaxID=433724 RepID=A0A5J4SQE1_9ZZZZ